MKEYSPVVTLLFSKLTAFALAANISFSSDEREAIAPTKGEIDYLLTKAQNNADYYALRLQNYLIAYSQFIPQYLQSIGNQTQIYPDQSNQYFGGIQL